MISTVLIGVIVISGKRVAELIEEIPGFLTDLISYFLQVVLYAVTGVANKDSSAIRIISALIDAIAVLSLVFIRPIFVLMLVVAFAVALVITIRDRIENKTTVNRGSVNNNPQSTYATEDNDEQYTSEPVNKNDGFENKSFFTGMSLAEARKEYRRLLKQYHPDNYGGSTEMTLRINEDYEQYLSDSRRTG